MSLLMAVPQAAHNHSDIPVVLTAQLHQLSIAYRLQQNSTWSFEESAYLELLIALAMTADKPFSPAQLSTRIGFPTSFCKMLLRRAIRRQDIQVLPSGPTLTKPGRVLSTSHSHLLHLIIQTLDQLAPATIRSLHQLANKLLKKKRKALAHRWAIPHPTPAAIRRKTRSKVTTTCASTCDTVISL